MSYGNMNIPRKDGMDREDEEEMNIYANVDPINDSDVRTETENSQTPQHTGSETVRNRSSRAALVCLALLCVLLLTAVIVLCVHIKTKSTNYTEETHQLLTKISILTEEKHQLLTKISILTEETHQQQTKISILTEETHQQQTKISILTEETHQQQTKISILTEETHQQQTKISILTEETHQQQTKISILTEETHQQQTKISILTEETHQQQTKISILTEETHQQQTKISILTEERDELLTRDTKLTKERDELSSSNLELIKHRDQLNKEKNELSKSLRVKDGWIYYKSSLYFISSEKKSWTESRRYCTERGADLIIINNREEHSFVKKISANVNVWIGLTDRDEEGTWKWVDGSTPTSGLWASVEPNGRTYEDCAVNYKPGLADFPCNDVFQWICEDAILK